jgi:asparagine synthase (glutamine-hydrolysing)
MEDSGHFDMDFLKTLLDQHQAGISDHSSSLWSLLMYESFLRQHN